MAYVLLAIKPVYARLIISGKKTVEVRRRGTSIAKGDVLILYSSSPDMALLGFCRVADVNVYGTAHARRSVNGESCLTKAELAAYVRGADRVTLLGIESVLRLSRPIPLKQLRRLNKNIVIPQSYRFLRPNEIQSLAKHLKS